MERAVVATMNYVTLEALEWVVVAVIVGSVVACLILLFVTLDRIKQIKKHYKIQKGMSYDEITATIGNPAKRSIRGEKMVCFWMLEIRGKHKSVRMDFAKSILKSFG